MSGSCSYNDARHACQELSLRVVYGGSVLGFPPAEAAAGERGLNGSETLGD